MSALILLALALAAIAVLYAVPPDSGWATAAALVALTAVVTATWVGVVL